MGSRVTLELGTGWIATTWWTNSTGPRAGARRLRVLPEGRGILRGGAGNFAARTPLNIGAFGQFERRTVTRFGPEGLPLGPPVTFAHVIAPPLRTPEGIIANVEWNQRFGRRVLFKANCSSGRARANTSSTPDPVRGEVVLASNGTSRYRELEVTGRYLGGARRDLTVSYVRSHGVSDLNTYDQFYGNLRNPILRVNEYTLIPTDVPNRLIVQGTIGLPGQWDFVPVVEIRSGFPYSAINEYQDFVGPRNRAGRLPTVRTLDFALARPWQRQEVPVPGRSPHLQYLRGLGRARRPEQPQLTELWPVLQSARTLDWIRHWIGSVRTATRGQQRNEEIPAGFGCPSSL